MTIKEFWGQSRVPVGVLAATEVSETPRGPSACRPQKGKASQQPELSWAQGGERTLQPLSTPSISRVAFLAEQRWSGAGTALSPAFQGKYQKGAG